MGGSSDPPTPPSAAQSYSEGAQTYLQYLPQFQAAEAAYRQNVDPQRVQQQQALQQQFGPTQVKQQLNSLHQFDPESAAVRGQLAQNIQSDLASGYDLPPAYRRELTSNIRGAEAARGNVLGNAPISAETTQLGSAAQNLYQQHLQNAGSFLSSPTPEQQALSIQAVQPDRSSAYANPNAGYQGQQFALNNYQNLLAQYQLSSGGSNPWASALGGAASGASAGAAFGPYGAIIGGVAGGLGGGLGSAYSDERLKTDIHEIVKTKSGIPLIRFSYLGSNRKFIGVLAQDVRNVKPEAVSEKDGFMLVDYSQIGIPFIAL